METKIIKVVFGGRRYTTTAKRTRTDYGQMFEFVDIALPDTFEVIFSNSSTSAGTGKKMIGSQQRVLIPDEYLKTGQPIYAWVLVHDGEDDGRHMYSIKSPVDDMPDTSPEEPTPVEQSIISQAITALNSAVDTTTQKAQEATESADRAEQAAEGVEGYAERAEAAQSASEDARDRALEAKESAQESATATTEGLNEVRYYVDIINKAYVKIDNWTQIAIGASQEAIKSEAASAESAQQASQSAETASQKASEASQSASTASQKALEASQSATNAQTYQVNAESAKADAQTAQGLAETARNEAVSAKTGAEDARNEAQEIVDGITGKVEQIDSNTDRIESLEDDRYKPYAVDSASGSIASFPDGADNIPLKSCIVQIEPVQVGSGDPSPDNVRPITGWTGCEVQRTGKNLADEEAIFGAIQGWTSSDGVYTGEAMFIHQTYANGIPGLKFKPSTQYTVSVRYSGSMSAIGMVIELSYTDGTSNFRYCNSVTPDDFQLVSSAGKIIEKLKLSYGRNMVVSVSNFQIVEGSTATGYEPYTGQTYPITFPTEAGTVYGAYIDPINGELVTCPYFASYNGETLTGEWISDRDKYVAGTTPTIGAQVLNIGAVGETYPLTPTDIRTLLGTNNLWADTGDVSVEYRADTTLYIKRLTDSDTDMIADSNIVSGQYFMVGNDLYKATVNIASGASVIVGTNATKISLAQALNEINQ